jgi:hypothetical protein
VFYYTDEKELHFTMTHSKPFGFIYPDYEDGGALSVCGDFFLISWSHEFQHSCGNVYDMKCVEEENLSAFYNNMQIESYEVWHCQMGVKAEIDGSKVKNELKRSSLYNSHSPLQYFRDNLVFQVPFQMNLEQLSKTLGVGVEKFTDNKGNKLEDSQVVGELPISQDGIIDVLCKASVVDEALAKEAELKASTYAPNMKVLQLFEQKGGMMDII